MACLELLGFVDEDPMRFVLKRDDEVVYEWTDIDDFCYRPQRVRKETGPIYTGTIITLEDLDI